MTSEVLIIANSMIGDVIMTTGAIGELVRRHPGSHFTVVCSPGTRLLFSGLPGQSTIVPLVKQKHGRHWLDLFRCMGMRRWEAIYDFRGTMFSRFLRGPRSRPRRGSSGALEHKVVEASSILGPETNPASPVIWMTEEVAADVPSEIRAAGDDILVLGPGASRIGKAWPVDRFARAAAMLTAVGGPMENALVVAVGGPMDRAAAQAIRGLLAGTSFLDMTGADLLKTSAVMRRARLFVGNDSGMMHLSAASGAPTLGLFGPTDERLYGPWGDRSAAVRPADVGFIFGKTSKTVSTTHSQMESLQVEAVMAAAEGLLAR
ncbi:MAG: glycosyltransferase family 9 protein [Brevundimonas sp.]|uniref:glycosyltransferase family 9 protein n=1 Tax=Brevundimonas sp. TaxID=1871086 RepID=UPI002489B2D1|nr:glycosyltransferase family 9 protein [Brevundimonas sp.]MDI1326966.1 glycosyltransferase family 9 protein [Brevundimonas sp.]